MRAAFAAVGHQADDALLDQVRRGVSLEVFYELALGVRPAGPRFDAFVTSYREHYFLAYQGQAFPGVADGLVRLGAARPTLILAVATAKRTQVAAAVLERAGLGGRFAVVLGSDGLPHKPDPAILVALAARTGRRLDRAVLIGDTDRDLGCARAAGAGAIAVTWGGLGRAELADLGPDHLVDSFDELTGLLLGLTG